MYSLLIASIYALSLQLLIEECYSECRNFYGIHTPKRIFNKNVVVLVLGDLRKFSTPEKVRHFKFAVSSKFLETALKEIPAGGIEPSTNRLTVTPVTTNHNTSQMITIDRISFYKILNFVLDCQVLWLFGTEWVKSGTGKIPVLFQFSDVRPI